MTRSRLAAATFAAAALAISACGGDDASTTTQGAASTTATTTAAPTTTASTSAAATAGADTQAVVKAADAFLTSLGDKKSSAIVGEFGDTNASKTWSNLPAALSARSGVPFGEMSAAQKKAALALMKTALSDQGYEHLEQLLAADDYLAGQASGGGPGSGDYGSGNYYVAFYGEPSTTDAWTLQYTGHHQTFNISFKGDEVSYGPSFFGVEPISFDDNGTTNEPMKAATAALSSIIENLGDADSTAKLSQSYDDLLLGAQNDSPFPSQEGAKVTDLPAKAQAAVKDLIEAYVGDFADPAAKAKIDAYVDALDETTFAYSGGTDTSAQGFYARLQGPVLWIEFSTQNAIVVQGTHYHSIYRENGNDYGAGL